MIVREPLRNNRVRVYSDAGKKIIDVKNPEHEYSEAVVKASARIVFSEIEDEEAEE